MVNISNRATFNINGKVDKKWTVGHLYRSFHPEESFGVCRIREKRIFLA